MLQLSSCITVGCGAVKMALNFDIGKISEQPVHLRNLTYQLLFKKWSIGNLEVCEKSTRRRKLLVVRVFVTRIFP